jgi:hypothetical protein
MVFFEKYDMLFGADAIESTVFNEYGSKIIKLKNFTIKQKYTTSDEYKVISGKNFIFQYDQFIWHYLQEMVGQYEVVKTFIKDIKPVFLDPSIYSNLETYSEFKTINKTHLKYLDDIHDIYALDDNVYQYNQNIIIEEVYMILDLKGYFPDELFIYHGVIPYWSVNKEHEHRHFQPSGFWQLDGLKLIKEELTKHVKTIHESPKKIYISRKDSAKRHEQIQDEDPFWYTTRTFTNEDYIEQYFISQGYQSFQFEGVPYLEQLNLLHNATHIAGTIGSAFINTFICKENTNLIEIHVKKDYHFSYEYITNMFNINRLKIDLKYLDDIKDNWGQKEINELKLELDKHSSFYE